MQVHVCVHVCAAPTPSTWAAHTLNQGQRWEQGRADTCSYNAGQRGCHAAGLTRGWGGSWRRGPFRRALDPPASASWPRPRPLCTCCSIQVTFCAEASAGPRPPRDSPGSGWWQSRHDKRPRTSSLGGRCFLSPPCLGPQLIRPCCAVRGPSFWQSSHCPLPWSTDHWVLGGD